VGGFTLQLPATGLGTIEIPVMGRDEVPFSGASAPFFTTPTGETTTGIFAAVNGLIQVNGTTRGVVTGLNVQMDLSPSSDAVVGQNFVPEIFLGRANVTGQLTAMFEDVDLINNFVDEDEISILAYLTPSNGCSRRAGSPPAGVSRPPGAARATIASPRPAAAASARKSRASSASCSPFSAS
jgi:hypothetical protein